MTVHSAASPIALAAAQGNATSARAADPLLDRPQAAEYLGVTPGTLEVWASTGRYSLPFVKVGRSVKYRKSDLDAWLAKRTRNGHANAK